MLSDLKLAYRTLARTPGFTVLVVLTLALGIGLNTAMFTLLNSFLLRPLGYPRAERLFHLERETPQRPFGDHAPANFTDIASATGDVAELAGARSWGFTVTEPDKAPDSPNALRVTSNYFHVLGTRPALGRAFRPEEDEPGRNNVVILGHRYWQNRYDGAADIIGRTIKVDGTPVEIVGVMPPDPDTIRILGEIGIYRPMAWTNSERASRTDHGMDVIGRYRDGVTPEQALARFRTVGERLAADHVAENGSMSLGMRSLQSLTLTGTGRNVTLMLVGLSSVVLLIACANLANLLLARALARAREFSIRAALGASRLHLIKPLAAECALLAAAGGLAASLVSAWTTDWLSTRFGSPDNPADFSTDGRVLAFMIGASLLTALFFGVAPAWWAARQRISDSLKSGSRGSGDRTQHLYRNGLIVVQFALSLILLAGAGLFIRGLSRLIGSDMGWNPVPVVSGVVNLASARYSTTETIVQFHDQLRENLLAQPGVANVAVSFASPLFNPPAQRTYVIEGRAPPPKGQEIVAFVNGVSASFLDVMGARLRRGRFIDGTDQVTSRPVVVINATMARTLFGGDEAALGQRLTVAGQPPAQAAEIVGVVDDLRALNTTPSPIRFQVFKPFTQESWQYVTISVRATDAALAPTLVEPIRQAVAALDPEQPVFALMTIPKRIEGNFGVWETVKRLLVAFAALGLLLAALGIYGVIMRLVTQRTPEIGIRMALGAGRRNILALVLGGGLRTSLIGIAVGTVGAVFFTRFLNQVLPTFGGSAVIPVTAGAGILLIIALLACWLPARRATKVDPMVALRSE
jgi:putative ABC transport system permease protein